MKKTISAVLALIVAISAIFVLSAIVFAADGDANTADTSSSTAAPVDERNETSSKADESSSSSKADTSSSSSAPANVDLSNALDSLSSAINSVSKTTLPNKPTADNAETVTNKPGETAFVNDDVTGGSTTKAPAKVVPYVPNTGSSFAVPAIALLALMAGTVAVVKTKKNDD